MTKELLEYFNQDQLAASVWLGKYAMDGEITPDDMHRRLAKAFASTQTTTTKSENLSDYGQKRADLTEESIYELFNNFKFIV